MDVLLVEECMTPIMKRTENKENAVSPVVGVMLMLVVTIVIAAVVAVFATGVVTTTEKAPVAMLTATVDSDWNNGWAAGKGTVTLTSLSGDTIDFGKVTTLVSVDINEGTMFSPVIKKYSCTYVGKSGEKLESGSTFNLAYKCTCNDTGNYTLSALLKNGSTVLNDLVPPGSVIPGQYVHVTVIYDDKHILYDKEVVAV